MIDCGLSNKLSENRRSRCRLHLRPSNKCRPSDKDTRTEAQPGLNIMPNLSTKPASQQKVVSAFVKICTQKTSRLNLQAPGDKPVFSGQSVQLGNPHSKSIFRGGSFEPNRRSPLFWWLLWTNNIPGFGRIKGMKPLFMDHPAIQVILKLAETERREVRLQSCKIGRVSSGDDPRKEITGRAFPNGPSQSIDKSPLWDVEKVKCSFSSSVYKSNEELIGEIAELDTEILLLERYLLSLYRSSFGDHLPASLSLDNSPLPPYKTKFYNDRASSESDKSVLSSFKSLSEMDKIKRSDSGHPSLADLLGLNTLSPNKLSEEILRSICVVHYKLSDKQGHSRIVKKNSKNENINEELGVVIGKLCLEDDNLKSVESLLQNFRSLVQKLEKVDPERMAREEKLAFWINIHNALVMHAYIVYGFSEDTTSTTILKAAFNIGGERINAYDVQSSILGIHACHSPSRLWTLFSPARSSKTSSGRHTYSLDYAEPLLHFALSTGASTDPMVRLYTAEGIFQELRQARDIFIQKSVGFEKETKILLPKIIYNYAKDTSLDMAELFNTISECLTETQRTTLTRVVKKKQDRYIRWINHDSNFHYIIHPELVRESF